jgi:DNA invertase Pin-like site-specific DNA recombinase
MTTKGPKTKSDGKQLHMKKGFEKTAAIYVRKSSVDGRPGEVASLADQKTECENWAKANGFTIVEHYAEPVGTSVSRFSMKTAKVFNSALDEMGQKYHTLIAYELSRATRMSALSLENAEMLHKISEAGGRLISLCGWIDTDGLDDMGNRIKLLLGMEFAAEESEKISMRSKRGKEGAARRNKHAGGQAPYGLDRKVFEDGTTDLVRNDFEIEVFNEMIDLLLEGMSTTQVARVFNDREVTTKTGAAWTGSGISRMMKHPHWIGHRKHKDDVCRDEHGEPFMCSWGQLVDPAKFYAVRKELDARYRAKGGQLVKGVNKPRARGNTIISGLIWCGNCNQRMHKMGATAYHTNPAGERIKRQTSAMRARCCVPSWGVRYEMMVDLVALKALNYLAQMDPESEMMTEVARAWLHTYDVGSMRMRGKLEGDAAGLEDRKNQLLELFTDGIIDKKQLKEQTTKLDSKLVAIEAELASMPADTIDITPLLDLINCSDEESLIGEGSAWRALEHHQQRKILNCIVDKVTVEAWTGSKWDTGKKRSGAVDFLEERSTFEFVSDHEAVEKGLRSDDFRSMRRYGNGAQKQEVNA